MRKIAIHTAQNVTIDMETATIVQRILAFALDLALIGFGAFLLMLVLGAVLGEKIFYLYALLIPFYTLVLELLMNGRTPGKSAMKIRVVTVDGQAPSALDLFIRWAFRLIDIWLSIGSLALVFISTSPRSRRLGGLLGNTMVIRVSDVGDLTLRDILSIEDRDTYTPVYEEVYRFNEMDMLTVKEVIDRYDKYRNTAHGRLVSLTAERCRETLGLETLPEDRFKFLRVVLRDYIVISRS